MINQKIPLFFLFTFTCCVIAHRKLSLSVTPSFNIEIIISEARSTDFKQWMGY
ncbi:MAG: hypothetical protein ACI38V_08410 [Bacteroides sp.]